MFSQTGREDFWGTELSSKKKAVMWPEEGADESEDDVQHTLFLHYACLGIGTKPGETNIITLSTEDSNGEDLTLPIAWLSESHPQVSLRLPVTPPVILKLAQGSGPVAVGGVHEQVLEDIGLSDDEDDGDDGEKEEMSSPEVTSKAAQELSRKRPAPSPATASGKKDAKVMKKKDEDEEGSDDEEDESSGEELDQEEVVKYLKAKGLFNGGSGRDNEGESEDDDDGDADDDEEEDDEEEEEEDSEEEEMEPLPVPKKKQAGKKPASQLKAKDTSQTPKQQKGKTPLAQPAKKDKEATPTTVKATPKGKPAPPSVDQVKARLLKSPNLPKKPEKFANFVKNTFKIDDASVQKQLWEFVQKSKK